MKKLLLETDRLIIRNLNPKDVDDFYFYRSNPEVTRYQSFDVMTREQAEKFIESQKDRTFGKPGEWVQYAIEKKETEKLIGDCAIKLDHYDQRIAEIGITLSHTEQKKGFARETMNAVLQFLFSLEDFHRVVEIVDAENESSVKLLENCGFKKEGHFIENIFFKGKWGSEFQYAMLRKDWEALVAED
ncbi:GNAT family N-acetyltransferase [Chryseobacterium sp. 09-1422]|uniref:GNAT family N-acetyltransferase n=1 Tax=Chryseobacterium kimseyorum TaxID=2984028 RepID=A0ABT3I1W7_9FLAO|nr:GNAT family protein [Chryseobacterium kimseyorum]MCW3170041.1 GNAT family N-acetyltransferase [Chryseobacterium kimseyorum]